MYINGSPNERIQLLLLLNNVILQYSLLVFGTSALRLDIEKIFPEYSFLAGIDFRYPFESL